MTWTDLKLIVSQWLSWGRLRVGFLNKSLDKMNIINNQLDKIDSRKQIRM